MRSVVARILPYHTRCVPGYYNKIITELNLAQSVLSNFHLVLMTLVS